MSAINALLVDDEAHARELMKSVFALFNHRIKIVGEAENLPNAIRQIQDTNPHVVFLDIDMPKYSGLQLKEFINDDVLVIYVTAHSQYAIDALRLEAFDYLLKPISINDLKRCVARIANHFDKKNTDIVPPALDAEQKISIHTQKGTHFISKQEIYYIEAAAMYSVIHFESEQLIVSKPLKEFNYLEEVGFFRTHRSFLVNTNKVTRFSTAHGNEVILHNGNSVPVSRSMKDLFMKYMENGGKRSGPYS